MSERLFDPEEIFSAETEANATKRDPLPVGTPNAQVTEMKLAEGKSGPKSKKPGTPWARIDFTCEITDPEYLRQVGDGNREKAVCFYGIMVQMNGRQIAVGPDTNVELGKFREAAGVNGKPLNAILGSWVKLNIVHEPHFERQDETVHKVAAVSAAD